jgi:GH43 family beta-xylosidase
MNMTDLLEQYIQQRETLNNYIKEHSQKDSVHNYKVFQNINDELLTGAWIEKYKIEGKIELLEKLINSN